MSVEFRFVTVSEVYEPERDTSSLHVLKTPHKKTDGASFFKILVYSPKSFNLSVEFRFVTVSEVYEEPERDTFGLHVLKTPHKKTDSTSFFFLILVYSPKRQSQKALI